MRLYMSRGASLPDYIKRDMQGSELEILAGFSDLTKECLGIKLEALFFPI